MLEAMTGMGMADAFDRGKADLSGIGVSTDGNLFIDDVIQNAYLEFA